MLIKIRYYFDAIMPIKRSFFILFFILSFSYASFAFSTPNQSKNIVDYNLPASMGYWVNWNIYINQQDIRAIPIVPYFMPGSFKNPYDHSQIATNDDFHGKLNGLNIVIYAFMQAQTKTYTYFDHKLNKMSIRLNPNYETNGGSLYFTDPWADIGDDHPFCNDLNNQICWYVFDMLGMKPNNTLGYASFSAFIKLTRPENSTLGPLRKIISIGGDGNNATFEDTFHSEKYINNFANSASKLIKNFYNNGDGLVGFDLNYENPLMSHKQSEQYAILVKTLREKLNKEIGEKKYLLTISIMADPEYIMGTKANNTMGFTKNALKTIAKNSDYINLMTYNFHGAFSYRGDMSGVTGFITNLLEQKGQPPSSPYSIQNSVSAMTRTINGVIPNKRIVIGIPAFGYTLSDIDPSNHGLFQRITKKSLIVKSTADMNACSQTMPLDKHTCSGNFSYRYIVTQMINKGFVPKLWMQDGIINGATAYAKKWTTKPFPGAYKPLKIYTYQNVFMSYCPPEVVQSVVMYIIKNDLGGTMLWKIRGDIPFNENKGSFSILGTILNLYKNNK